MQPDSMVQAVRESPGSTGEFACPTCDKAYETIEHLQRHMNTYYSDYHRYPCGSCGCPFVTRSARDHYKCLSSRRRHTEVATQDRDAQDDGVSSFDTDQEEQDISGDLANGSDTQSEGVVSDTIQPATPNTTACQHSAPNTVPHSTPTTKDPLEPLKLVQGLSSFTDKKGSSLDWDLPFRSWAGTDITWSDQDKNTAADYFERVFSEEQSVFPNPLVSPPDSAYIKTQQAEIDPEPGTHPAPPKSKTSESSWKVTEQQRAHIKASRPFSRTLTGFQLPSRHTSTRYMEGCVDGAYNHFPFMHIPTLRLGDCAPELALALCAVGSQYRFETKNGTSLYHAAKAIVDTKIRQRDCRLHGTFGLEAFSDSSTAYRLSRPIFSSEFPGSTALYEDSVEHMEIVHTMLLLSMFGSSDQNAGLMRESLGFQSILARSVREDGLIEPASGNQSDDWNEWIRSERDRRTKLSVFSFLNLQTIAYDLPPVIMSNEPGVHVVIRFLFRELMFQDVLSSLLSAKDSVKITQQPTPFGNHVLLQAIIQRLWLVNQLPVLYIDQSGGINMTEATRIESALSLSKASWQHPSESSLNSKDRVGAIPFTSTALITLAYVRLHINLGSHRKLETRDPTSIAAELQNSPPLRRSDRLETALLYSVRALNLPVKLGIDYVSHSQASFWGIQHSLCSLECAVLLSKWLHQVAQTWQTDPLSQHESQVLDWIELLVEEAQSSISDLCEASDQGDHSFSSRALRLSVDVVKIWARIFRKINMWPMVSCIGQSLELYAGII